MALTLIDPPAVTPLTLAEVKKHLRVSSTDNDDLITIYLKAATAYIDGEWGFLGRAIVTQTWRLTLDQFPNSEIKIPLPPLQSVTNIRYDDGNGNEQIVPTDDYYVDTASEPGWVVPTLSGWPSTLDAINAVRVEFIAGYSPDNSSPPDLTGNIPFNIKAGLMLLVANMYEHREENVVASNMMALPFGADILLRRHKIDMSMA